MEFRVLGPLEVRDADGGAVGLGGPRPRAVLARLLVAQGAVVPAETLIDDLYGDAPRPAPCPPCTPTSPTCAARSSRTEGRAPGPGR
ncbi:AfsR/SARP family transcriptional regulator [Actinomadura sp. ATCC 39365]